MKFILDLFKGALVGVANIIPGVSGGTMAVSVGIYDKIIESITNITKQFKKSFLTLLPIAIGMVLGIGIFSFIIPHCLTNYSFQTCMCFTGLILGGVPELITSTGAALKKEKHKLNPIHIIFFLLFLGVAIFMALANPESKGADSIATDWLTLLKLFGLGILAAATMVIPGISGSLLLMMLGYYAGIVGTVSLLLTSIKALDGAGIGHCVLVLVPFAIGCILGILLISKIISWLFKRFESITYCAILGLIAASPFAIFYKMEPAVFNTVNIIVGIVLFIAGTCLTYFMSVKTKKSAK